MANYVFSLGGDANASSDGQSASQASMKVRARLEYGQALPAPSRDGRPATENDYYIPKIKRMMINLVAGPVRGRGRGVIGHILVCPSEGLVALWSLRGDLGLVNKPFPIGKGTSNDPRILSSAAFGSRKEKESRAEIPSLCRRGRLATKKIKMAPAVIAMRINLVGGSPK